MLACTRCKGADIIGRRDGHVRQGQKIEAAVNGVDWSPQGVPIARKLGYAGRCTLYTAAGPRKLHARRSPAALFGNDTGIRRALDRIHEGRVRRQTLPWMDKLLNSESAPIIAGADLRAQAIPRGGE